MRKLLIALLFLAGCTSQPSPAPAVIAPTTATTTEPFVLFPDGGDESGYMSLIIGNLDLYASDRRGEYVELGYALCDALERGETPDQILESAGQDRNTTAQIGVAASVFLCPQFDPDDFR